MWTGERQEVRKRKYELRDVFCKGLIGAISQGLVIARPHEVSLIKLNIVTAEVT